MRDFIELLKAFGSCIINLIILFIGAFLRLYILRSVRASGK